MNPPTAATGDATSAESGHRSGTLSRGVLAAYAAPAFSQTLIHGPTGYVIQGAYAKYFGVPLAAIAAAMLVTGLYDAAINPLAGYLSDRHCARGGTRKPWLLGGSLISAIACWFLFAPSGPVTSTYLLVALLLTYTGWAIAEVPYSAWMAEITDDYNERTRLATWRGVAMYGGAIAFAAIPYLPFFHTTEFTPESLRWTAVLAVIVLPALSVLALVVVPAGSIPRSATGGSVWSGVFRNKPLMRFALMFFLYHLGPGIFNGLLFFYVDSHLHLGGFLAGMFLMTLPVGVVAVPLWGMACRRFGKQRAWAVGSGVGALLLLSFALVPPGPSGTVWVAVIQVCVIAAFAGFPVAAPAVLVDVIDYGRLRFGVDYAGTYFSIYNVMYKAMPGIGGAVGLALAGWAGFDPQQAEQSTGATVGLLVTFCVLPALILGVVAPLLWYFPIDERRQRIIARRLEQRDSRARRSLAAVAVVCIASAMLGWANRADAAEAYSNPGKELTSGKRDVARWAQERATAINKLTLGGNDSDLEPLRAIVGSASVVSFGEGLHGGAEPLEFRNRLFEYLVEKLGFSAIAIESGLVEGFAVNHYVLTGEGDLESVLAKGFSFGFNRLPQERALVEWMRRYNADPSHSHKVEFYGFDVSGDPQRMQAPLFAALDYLKTRDPSAAAALRARIKDLEPMLNLDRGSDRPNQYTQLTQAQRDTLTATISDLIATIELHETDYAGPAPDRAYRVAYRTAIAARQVDDYLRQIPIGWKPKDGYLSLAGTVASADRTKADNAQWIREQLGPGGKLLLFAHRDHLAPARSVVKMPPNGAAWELPPMMGLYLKPRYGAQLITIGHFLASNASHCGKSIAVAPRGSMEAVLSSVPHDDFLLDLRAAPPQVTAWLGEPREFFGAPPLNTASVGGVYDAIFFTRRVSPAIPCSASSESSREGHDE